MYLSRSTAEQECNEKKHAHLEPQRIIAVAELVKSSAQEELEAQKIYAKAAHWETESLEILAQVRAKLADPTAFLGNGAELENYTVQLNAARENKEPGKPPVPSVEPNVVEPNLLEPSPVEPNTVEPNTVGSEPATKNPVPPPASDIPAVGQNSQIIPANIRH